MATSQYVVVCSSMTFIRTLDITNLLQINYLHLEMDVLSLPIKVLWETVYF